MSDTRDDQGRIRPAQPLNIPPADEAIRIADVHALHHFSTLEINASRGERPSPEAAAGLRTHIAELKKLGSPRAAHWEAETARIRIEFDSWGIPYPTA